MVKRKISQNSAEKVAILLLMIGQDRAANILRHMSPREVQIVGAAMSAQESVSMDGANSVFEEFIVQVKGISSIGLDSDSYIRNTMLDAFGPEKASIIIDKISLSAAGAGVEQLKWVDANTIVKLIKKEHPQVVATILSLLDDEQSAEVLALIPEKLRSNLISRVATMSNLQPAAIQELNVMMEHQWFGMNAMQSSVGGVQSAANILNLMEARVSAEMVDEIVETDEALGTEIQNKMFAFDDFINVDERSIQTLLREITTEQLLIALRGVKDELKEKIFSNMSKRAATMMKEDLEVASPTKVSEVEFAQKEILNIAKKLSITGEMALGKSIGDEFI